MAHHLLTAALFLLATFLVLAPLVLHEMGHWAALHRFGVPAREFWIGLGPVLFRWGRVRIAMLPIGGAIVPEPESYARLPALSKLMVALAGPAASLLCAVVVWFTAFFCNQASAQEILFPIAYLNFVLTAVNLLPVPPLDGFQAWAAWREHRGVPLAPATLNLATRVGNGWVYGIGFLALGYLLVR